MFIHNFFHHSVPKKILGIVTKFGGPTIIYLRVLPKIASGEGVILLPLPLPA